MSRIACDACDNLRDNASDFVMGGVNETICASLANNTGFNPNLSTLHTDDEDLHDANDCLIGSMDSQLDMYEVCDWKEFMHKFIPNIYETLKGIICAIGGIWINIQKLGNRITQIISSLGGDSDNIPVIRTYRHVIKQENFVKVSFDGVTPVCWFSGAGGDWEGDVFSIPVETMDTILGVYCQVRTVGNKTNPETVAIQTWRREGDRLIIDIDGYEVIFNGYDPYDLPVDILVVGTKKVN